MRNATSSYSPEIAQAFQEWDRTATIYNFKVACYIGIVLMPAGAILDHFVHHEHFLPFLGLRLLSSVMIAGFLLVLLTPFAKRHYRMLGVALAMLPSSFLSLMIFFTHGGSSTYYAGLNLVLLTLAFVMHWTFRESLIAVLLVILMYLTACFFAAVPIHDLKTFITQDHAALLNNVYFLVLTGLIVVTGRFFHSQMRFREFALRYELDKKKQELVELDQVKSRFFANISHELRTPLTLLLAPLETLIYRYRSELDTETRNLLVTMQSNGMRLLKLINDLLDLVRLESGVMQVKREPLDVAEFVKGLASAARQVADDKRIKLETSVAADVGTVLADRDKLEKIILNLQFNALKFTPAGGRVEVRAEKQGDELVLTVQDTGMGISEKNLPNVFNRQADDSSRRKYQGVGIGLALVKEFAEIQGGSVAVASREGKGTTFTVRLPYQQPQPGQEVQAPDATPAVPAAQDGGQNGGNGGTVTSHEWLANLYRRAELFPSMTPVQESLRPVETGRNGQGLPTLLIADDEPDMLRFLKSQLSTHYRVYEAVDGQQAIEKAAQFLPDMILLDMMMPEKDGLQACREIRQRTSTATIPVVLLTARADEETKLAALAAGASDFLTKPFSTTELHVRIKNLIESHQYQMKLAKQNQVLENTIEQLKETETQLVQSEKLASLGRMSAGIIHEINNPLNFATTGLYTLRKKGQHLAAEQQADYQEVLKDIEDGIKRVKNIVSDLRMFTHPDTESRDQVEIAEVVAAALRFLSNEWNNKVRIDQKLEEHQTIWANKNKLIHVLVNLLQNSLDALRTRTFGGEQPAIFIEGRQENGQSILVIRDNGPGIGAEHLDKIFDPFFTTKDVGEGMGLGLAICHRIVQDCEGKITVRTEPGKFCEFRLQFPVKGAD